MQLKLLLTRFPKQGISDVGVGKIMNGSNWNKQTSILQGLLAMLLTTHKTLVSSGLVSCGW